MKETFFFPHDFGARNDPKLQNLLMECGCVGLGVFWCIVEQIYEQGGSLPIATCKSIAFALHVECNVVEKVVNDFDLFKNDGTLFWSNSINARLNKRANIVEKRKQAAANSWKSRRAKQMQSKSDANVMVCNAIKEKKRKEKNNIEKSKKEIFDFGFVEKEFEKVFFDWLEYKKQRKESYKSQKSLQACYTHLKELSDNDPETMKTIVEQSMANNWMGLFELKKGEKQKKVSDKKDVNDIWQK
jgi:gluconate kinase